MRRFGHSTRVAPLVFCLVLGLAPGGSPPASAQEAISLDQAARQVQQQYGGKVLRAERVEGEPGPVYRFKVLQPSGRVKQVLIDARTGRPPEARGNDR